MNEKKRICCWNCNATIVKGDINAGLMKSQVAFIANGELIARCKVCKSDNVLPYKLTYSKDPVVNLYVMKDAAIIKGRKKPEVCTNRVSSGKIIITKQKMDSSVKSLAKATAGDLFVVKDKLNGR